MKSAHKHSHKQLGLHNGGLDMKWMRSCQRVSNQIAEVESDFQPNKKNEWNTKFTEMPYG